MQGKDAREIVEGVMLVPMTQERGRVDARTDVFPWGVIALATSAVGAVVAWVLVRKI
jgi:hypothetical protein